MTVILLILKIIGIVLLSLLGIALFLLALALLVPIRYRIYGEHGEEVQIGGSLHWLLHLVKVSVSFQKKEWDYGIFLCGFRLPLPGKNPQKPDAKEPDEAGSDEKGLREADTGETDLQKTDSGEGRRQKANTGEAGPQGADTGETDLREADSGSETSGEKASLVTRIRKAVGNALNRVKELSQKIAEIKSLLTDETNQKSMSFVFAELKYLLRHSRFRRIRTDLVLSLGDPAATGMGLGALSLFPVIYQKEIKIYPDFEAEKAYVEGYYEVKGHIRLVHAVISLFRLWKKREFRKTVKQILKS